MRKFILIFIVTFIVVGCKKETKEGIADEKDNPVNKIEKVTDSIVSSTAEIIEEVKTVKQIKKELTSKGFKLFDYVDEKTKDTLLIQQYFMAFLKKGPIRGQNEEEAAELQKEHLAHLSKMYELGYADISGPFGDEGDIRGVTIYNVPTLKIADSLANSDPMVKAGRLEIELHPWWAAKGYSLR
ncbi:MAG: hypothetical protein HKO01_01490 [Flaviramulus sp.]|nr:YciI family protein [Flaviramulus sp.]NNC49193.1 hypothetical protein [Flaviramulus sp.]